MPQDDSPSEVEEPSNYDDDRQYPRISDTRFIGEPVKLPSVALMKWPDTDKLKLNIGKPTVLISIGIPGIKTSDDLQENCSKKNHRKHNQNWQLQQPFYVDEPRWIEIDPEYVDSSSNVNGDPYILSRGKKIFRIKNPEQANKIVENSDEFSDYSSKGKRSSVKNRVRRSIEVDAIDEKVHNIVHQDQRPDNDENYAALNVNKRNIKSVIPRNEKFAEGRKKYETHAVDWTDASSDKEIKKNETDVLENKVQVDNVDDTFILSRGKKSSETETLSKQNVDLNHKKLSDEQDKSEIANNAGAADSRLTSLFGESEAPRASVMRDHPDREKRSACEGPGCMSPQLQLPDEWLKNIEKEIHDSLSLERRDKHRDILESLRLMEPYVISRGKKALHAEDRLYSALKSRIVNDQDSRVRMLLNPSAARSLLRMLLMAKSRCGSDNCDRNTREPSLPDQQELAPRDRRGTLDEILAGYDPFYVARGKRGSLENVLKMTSWTRPSWNQRDVSFNKDAARNDKLQ
ncbi:hypothetical protein X777_13153 [Ooceraea biroi]|nr:hypothetical protein X777_13153 [Ooceraea biroi]